MLLGLVQTGGIRRFSRTQRTVGVSVLVAVVLFLVSNLGAADEQDADTSENLATPVGLMTLEVEDEIVVERRFLGRIEAQQSADLAFGLAGTIDLMAVREGKRVQQGALLARVNTDAFVVQLETLRDSLEVAQSQLDIASASAARVQRLVNRNAAPSSRLTEAEADVQFRESQVIDLNGAVSELELRIAQSELVAPFDGIVGLRAASQGETVAPGQTVISIYRGGRPDFRVGIPSTLSPDTLGNTRIRVNGEEYPVRLRAVRPDIDFRTNTQIAIFEVMNSDLTSFGLSATLVGEVVVPLRGAWVPVDAMRPSAQGYWIVLAVGEDMIARRVAVEVLHLRDDAAYVTGVFETGTQIISVGAHKVVPGQAVRVD